MNRFRNVYAALIPALLMASAIAQPANTWFRTNGPLGGYVSHVAVYPFDPDKMIAYTDSGLYRTTNGGAGWQRMATPDPSFFTTMYISTASRPDIFLSGLYNGGSVGLLRSTDDGVSWHVIADIRLYAIVPDPQNPSRLYAGGDSGSVYVSSNAGLSWARLSIGSQWRVSAVAVNPAMPHVLFAGTTADYTMLGDGVFRTTDAGATWSNVALANTNISAVVIDPLQPMNVYVATRPGNYIFSRGIYKSTDGGDNWFPVNTGVPPDSAVSALLINPLAPQQLYAGVQANLFWTPDFIALYKTKNGGNSWFPVDANIDVHSVTCLTVAPSDPSRVLIGGIGLLRGSFSSPNLTSIGVHSVGVRSIALCPQDQNTLYAIGESVFKSTNGGNSWDVINKGLWEGHVVAADPVNPNVLYAGVYDVNYGGVSKTTDGGLHWLATSLTEKGIQALAVDPVSPNVIYAGGYATLQMGGLFRSTDSGATWETLVNGLNGAVIRCIVIDPEVHTTVYAGTLNRGVLKSTNQGGNWFSVNTGLPVPSFNYGYVNDIAIDPIQSSTLYTAIYPLGVFKSTNGGGSWDSTNVGINDRDVRTLEADQSGFVYAGTWDGGPRESTNRGISWHVMNSGEDVRRLTSLALRTQDALFAGTDGDGVWRYNFQTSGVNEHADVATRATLLQNYPNPFNPSTNIRFQLPQSGLVELKVYDVLGREVATLVNEVRQPGTHDVMLDASKLASGIYFYRLQSGPFVQTRKLSIIR